MHSNDDIDWPVHSLLFSFHDLRGLPLRRLPSAVPCSMTFSSVSWWQTWPNHDNFWRLTVNIIWEMDSNMTTPNSLSAIYRVLRKSAPTTPKHMVTQPQTSADLNKVLNTWRVKKCLFQTRHRFRHRWRSRYQPEESQLQNLDKMFRMYRYHICMLFEMDIS